MNKLFQHCQQFLLYMLYCLCFHQQLKGRGYFRQAFKTYHEPNKTIIKITILSTSRLACSDLFYVVYLNHAHILVLYRRNISYQKAVEWYLKAIAAIQNDDSEDYDSTMDHPIYLLQAKVAELYLEGGPELDKDYQAAGSFLVEITFHY